MRDEAEIRRDLPLSKRKLKSLLWVLALLIFLMNDGWNAFHTLQYLWSCFFLSQHDLAYGVYEDHIVYGAVEAARSLTRFTIIIVLGIIGVLLLDILHSEHQLNKSEIKIEKEKLKQQYDELDREKILVAYATDLTREVVKLRLELRLLLESIIKIKVEASRVNQKPPVKIDETMDLFKETSSSNSRTRGPSASPPEKLPKWQPPDF